MATPIRQLLSRASYNGDSATTVWDFSFAGGYLDQAHVKASTRNTTTGDIVELVVTPGSFVGPYQLLVSPAVPLGTELTIYRNSPKDLPLVNFADKAALTEAALDLNAKQAIFVAAESSDAIGDALTDAGTVAAGLVAGALAHATAAAGSATTASTQAGIATTKAGEALASKDAAALSEAAAALSASNAATNANAQIAPSLAAAEASAAEALGYLQAYRATSYGALAADPLLDPLGNAPTAGDEYFNTTSNLLKRFNGTAWQVPDINTTNLAAAGGAGSVGANAYQTQHSVNLEQLSIKRFGAKGDGVTDDALAIIAAVTENPGKAIYMPDPAVNYLLKTPITLPPNTRLYGAGKRSTKLKKAFTGDAFIWQDGAGISHATIDCDGATYTGRGIVLGGTDGRQTADSLRCINADGAALDFATLTAGSQSNFNDCELYRINAGTGTGRYAVTMAYGEQLGAVPRKFSGLETSGTCAFDFGGCNDVFVLGSFIGDVNFTDESRAVNIVGGRLANQLALTVAGHNNSIVGGDISPQITIAPGADANTIGPGSFNNLPVIDNSGNNRNSVHHWTIPYTPVLTSGGTAPVLGNGALSGEWSRQGHIRHMSINFTVGSTTTLGTGALRFSLPEIHRSGKVAVSGEVVINRGGTIYTALVQLPGNVAYCELLRDTTGSVTFNSPAVFAAGDTIRIGLTY